jgi:hypothetical protein
MNRNTKYTSDVDTDHLVDEEVLGVNDLGNSTPYANNFKKLSQEDILQVSKKSSECESKILRIFDAGSSEEMR